MKFREILVLVFLLVLSSCGSNNDDSSKQSTSEGSPEESDSKTCTSQEESDSAQSFRARFEDFTNNSQSDGQTVLAIDNENIRGIKVTGGGGFSGRTITVDMDNSDGIVEHSLDYNGYCNGTEFGYSRLLSFEAKQAEDAASLLNSYQPKSFDKVSLPNCEGDDYLIYPFNKLVVYYTDNTFTEYHSLSEAECKGEDHKHLSQSGFLSSDLGLLSEALLGEDSLE